MERECALIKHMIAARLLNVSGRRSIEVGVMQEISQLCGMEHGAILDWGSGIGEWGFGFGMWHRAWSIGHGAISDFGLRIWDFVDLLIG